MVLKGLGRVLMMIAALLFVAGICYASEYTVSSDFELLSDAPGGYQNVRLFAVTQGPTSVKMIAGTSEAIDVILNTGDHIDWNMSAGTKIVTDNPVVAVKYDGLGTDWNTVFAGEGTSFNVSGSEYVLIASGANATNISTDLNEDGVAETLNLNSGYAVVLSAGNGKNITSSNPVCVFTFNSGGNEFKNVYLLAPGSSAYVPLYPINKINGPDVGSLYEKMYYTAGYIVDGIKNLLSGVSSFFVADAYAAASYESNVNNGNGTYTFTQRVDEYSSSPQYVKPASSGFQLSGYYNKDYGWKHTFPYYAQSGLQIQSVILTVRAFDVDSEPSHGYNGEYDGITGDGSWLNPQYLQGTNGTWSVTNFNVDPSALNDGALNAWIDIDMHHNTPYWATTLDYSQLKVVYSFTANNPPHSPTLSISPSGCTYSSSNLAVNVTGPNPADSDGDSVTYEYRWMVDPGTGNYIDDEFAGRSNHTGNIVPSSDIRSGDRWMVEVTPVDEHGSRGTKNSVAFATIGQCNTPPIADAGGNRQVNANSAFSLDGSASYDSDGIISAYKWELYSGSSWVNIGTAQVISYQFSSTGTYTVRLTVTDNNGAIDDSIAYITVVAGNHAPVADAGTNQTVEQTSSQGANVTLNGSGSSDADGDTLTYKWTGPFGTASGVSPTVLMPAATSVLSLVVNDGKVNSATDTVVITVQDTTAPVVTVPANVTAEATGIQTAVVIGTATASDAVGVTSITSNAPATYPIGTTTVTWTATDAAGNTATSTQSVTVQDTTAPVVTVPANVTAEATGIQTAVVIGTATASDAVGVTSITSNAPATYPIGTTTVTWTATDAAGNTATSTQSVTVQDTTAPSITGAVTTAANSNGWYNNDVAVHFSATDSGSGIASVTPDTVVSTEGSELSVKGTATDNVGNLSSYTVSGINIDKTAPVISGSAVTAANSYGWYNTDVTIHFTATDERSGIKSVTPDITLSSEGASQSASGTAKDKADNTASSEVRGINIDKTSPVITIIGIQDGATYTLCSVPAAGFTVTDNLSGVDTQNGTLSGGNSNGVGKYTYTVKVADKAGNISEKSVTYTVVYNFGGFLPPVSLGKPFKLGSTIPVKFQLADNCGSFVPTAGATIMLRKFSGNEPSGEPIEAVSTVHDMGISFRYDATGSLYIYNLNTKGLSQGTWQVIVSIDDMTVKTTFITIKQ